MDDKQLVVDINAWNARDLSVFMGALRTNRFVQAAQVLVKVVKSWSYDLDPSDPESYTRLTLPQFAQIMNEVNLKARAMLGVENVDQMQERDADVDLNNWVLADFERFIDAVGKNNFVIASQEIAKVITRYRDKTGLDAEYYETRLPLLDYARLLARITSEVRDTLGQGK